MSNPPFFRHAAVSPLSPFPHPPSLTGFGDPPSTAGPAGLTPPAGPAEWSFPADPGCVRTARAVVRDTLRTWRLDPLTDVAVLLVSELVTNSMRYASGPVGLRLRPVGGPGAGGGIRVEVSDTLPVPPLLRAAAPDEEGGRGLQLVASVSLRWGTRCGGTGKTVWFELGSAG
ncbi:ATP-binding protein [Streptomyces sp. WMMC500]|uniref:ATP-binding protein n=1 Tax=Streptomyces sp. WMMC500 TaxID=3015154 RepID=UPI00248CFA80|nr:ATP-binding protein [Streptomyces sp. WMMC500]WBB63326.1 ATP-binding protein [Streptomyces sp. WMMC500]